MLYSTKVKLFPWIPSFVVSFITTKALVEVRKGITLQVADLYTHCLATYLIFTRTTITSQLLVIHKYYLTSYLE